MSAIEAVQGRDGITHAVKEIRELGGLVHLNEDVDCMSCVVHQVRQSR